MIDNLTDLRIFTRIVATGSLSQAGRALNLSLAVVSKRLAALEDRLGVRLNPTQEGAEFFERCQRILLDLEEAEAAVTTGRESPKGLLRVTAAVAFGRRRLAPAWALAGAGFVMKSIWDVGDDPKAGRLVRVLADWPSPAAAIHALYPTSRHLSAKVRCFVDYLGEHLRAADIWH